MSLKTLVFAGGAIHDYKAVGSAAKAALEAADGFDVTYVEEDLDVLTSLADYELLVFHYTVGEITDAQLNGLSNWLSKGNGYAGIHSAADSFRGSPGYRSLVGGHFTTHPRYRDYQVSLVDTEHEITQDVPEEFIVRDEQYILDYDPRVHVLATALWKGGAMPVAWTKPWGEGRVFYLALGHDGPSCKHEQFNRLLVQGSKWAGTKPAKGE